MRTSSKCESGPEIRGRARDKNGGSLLTNVRRVYNSPAYGPGLSHCTWKLVPVVERAEGCALKVVALFWLIILTC